MDGPKNQTSAQLETQTRRAFVIELRKSGATYDQIAQATIQKFGLGALPAGWDSRYAYKDVARELERVQGYVNGLAEDVKELEVQRLDRLLLAVWKKAAEGDLGAVDRALRIMERRARLLGLDAPTHLAVEDWREQAKAEGLDAGSIFETLVNAIAQMDGRGDSRGDSGSPETPNTIPPV